MPSLQLLLSQMLVPFIFNFPINKWQMYRRNIINFVVHFLEKRTAVLGKMKIDSYWTHLRETWSGSLCNLVVPGHALVTLAWENSRRFTRSPLEKTQPVRSTTKIWVVACHQYWIAALVTQTSFCEGSSGDFAKRWLFSQAIGAWV